MLYPDYTSRMRDLEIYLDMDGVCTDFITPAIEAHGLEPGATLDRWAREHPGEFYPFDVLDMEPDTFWGPLADLGEAFWVGLKAYEWFDEMFARLNRLGHVVFLTSPTQAPASVSGKLRWLQDRYGMGFQDFVFTTHKDRLAHGNAVLIDDYDVNVSRFVDRGGMGVVFPQFWNCNAHIDEGIEYVIDRVADYRAKLNPRVA